MFEERYSRQIRFAGLGAAGQERLGRSRTLLVGCGALGSVMAEMLVRAGVGRLTIADRDFVEPSNLQRQSLFTESDCSEGLPKSVAAVRRLASVNSAVELSEQVVDVHAGNIEVLVREQDLILDGTDNFETRFLINDASLKWNIPWVYGACVGAYGLCLAMLPGETPCLRCLLEHLPSPGSSPTCDTAGIIGPIVHLVAALEVAEALKILTGNVSRVNRKLVTMDLWENQVSILDLTHYQKDPECIACGRRNFEFLERGQTGRGRLLCGSDAVQIAVQSAQSVDFVPIAARLAPIAEVSYNKYLLRAKVEAFEIALFRDGRGIVRGTRDVEEASRVYAKYIGN
jgi:molybdopterin/thiamine biosynthesis adenylyltransferase